MKAKLSKVEWLTRNAGGTIPWTWKMFCINRIMISLMGQQVKSLAFRFSLSSVSKPNIVDRERERERSGFQNLSTDLCICASLFLHIQWQIFSTSYKINFQSIKNFLSIKNRFNVKETWKIVIITEASTLLGTHPKNKHKQGYEGPQWKL